LNPIELIDRNADDEFGQSLGDWALYMESLSQETSQGKERC